MTLFTTLTTLTPHWRPTAWGALSIYTGGGVPRHINKGGLRHGNNPKKGGLRHRHNPKKGGLRHGHNQCLRHGTSRKMGVLRTGLVKKTILVTDVAQKWVLGAYLLITLAISCQHDILLTYYWHTTDILLTYYWHTTDMLLTYYWHTKTDGS